jgi:HAD superfamily hydrolase (TIGR01662 family)
MKKRLIIFDLDNTLFQSKKSYKHILAEVIKERWGINEKLSVDSFIETDNEISKVKEYSSIKEFYKEFNKRFLTKILGSFEKDKGVEFEEILKEMKDLAPVKLKTYPYVNEILKELKEKGYKLAILTGTWEKKIESFNDPEYAAKKREILEKLLKNSGLDQIIDRLFITYEHATVKPDPKAFQMVLEHFNISPEEAIMIGDKEADMLASKIGISPILFDPEEIYLGDTKPDHKIKSFNELIKVLDSYN